MRIIDGMIVLNDSEHRDADLAEEELKSILGFMEEYLELTDRVKARLPQLTIKPFEGGLEDNLLDLFNDEYCKQVVKSRSTSFAPYLPSFRQIRQKKELRVPVNPNTYLVKGDPL